MTTQIMDLVNKLGNVDEGMKKYFPGVRYIDVEVLLLIGHSKLRYLPNWTKKMYVDVNARFGGDDSNQLRLRSFVAAQKHLHWFGRRHIPGDYDAIETRQYRYWNDMFLAMRKTAKERMQTVTIDLPAAHKMGQFYMPFLYAPITAPLLSMIRRGTGDAPWEDVQRVLAVERDDYNRRKEVQRLIESGEGIPSTFSWGVVPIYE